MLKITIEGIELYDEIKEEFIETKTQTLTLEHSLVSISKWESKWRRPFLSKEPMSTEETIDYVKCMTIERNVDPNLYLGLTNDHVEEIKQYIENPMTATTFSREEKGRNSGEIVTSELIYYWMTVFHIPPEYQKWHLNRLLTLIKICNIKNQPPKKMSQRDVMSRNAALNAARRKRLNSKG